MADDIALYVVLDANILIGDFWMSGPSFEYLLIHQFLNHHPIIPKVAYLEARFHLQERAETLLSNRSPDGKGSQGNTKRLLRLFNYDEVSPNAEWDINKLLERWDKHITSTLEKYGGQILQNPELSMEEIIYRSIERKKPFSNGDRGFRDTIIWLSTLNLADMKSRVSFITSNTQDFFQTNSLEPHPEILNEANKKVDKPWKMLFHRSLDEFITEFDHDRSASSEALQRALISNTLSGFNLWEWLEENLREIVGEDDFDAIPWAGLSYHAEAPVLVDIEELVAINIPRVSHLENDIYRFYCDLSFIGAFDCSIAFQKAEIIVNPNQILWKDETDSFWTSVGVRAVATFILRIDFDVKSKDVVNQVAYPLGHWKSYDQVIEDIENYYQEDYADN